MKLTEIKPIKPKRPLKPKKPVKPKKLVKIIDTRKSR